MSLILLLSYIIKYVLQIGLGEQNVSCAGEVGLFTIT